MLDQSCALPAVSLGDLVPVPYLLTMCGGGVGMTVCPTMGLLVTSNIIDDTLSVFALPQSLSATSKLRTGEVPVSILGGVSSPAPMRFMFVDGNGRSGWMAFTGPTTSRLLLVTDAGHDAVHIIDVVGQVHEGYVAAPGTIAGPRGIAARGSLVAVSAWKQAFSGDHVVHVFEGIGAMWTAVRVLAGGFGGPGSADRQLNCPRGLRFSGDGAGLAVVVADAANHRVTMLRAEDGCFVQHVATGLRDPCDVEECEGGWLVACGRSNTIESAGDGVGRGRLGHEGCGHGEFSYPTALALVPGLGLVVRECGNGGGLQFFATPDAIAMSSMSAARVGWMVAVARGAAHRACSLARLRQLAGSAGKRRRQRGSAM
jgi:hypothetical protein